MRKAQFGPGSHRGEATEGENCGDMGETDRSTDQSEPGQVRATQTYGVIAGQRAWKLRPNRVTVAPQAWGKAGALGQPVSKVWE